MVGRVKILKKLKKNHKNFKKIHKNFKKIKLDFFLKILFSHKTNLFQQLHVFKIIHVQHLSKIVSINPAVTHSGSFLKETKKWSTEIFTGFSSSSSGKPLSPQIRSCTVGF